MAQTDLYTHYAGQRKSRLADLIPSVNIPEGEHGTARISHFEISEEDTKMYNLRLAFSGQGHRAVAPGTYTRLTANGVLQMTDTPAEKQDHAEVVRAARGTCLITGLGLGMVANAMALKPEVEAVTVLEINPDVIALVAPTLHDKVTVIEADALEWPVPKGAKWDVIWHDIWPEISLDDCENRSKLSRKFARNWRVFHSAWAKEEIRRQQRESSRGYY